jgi:predicted HTH transcriptional regulator
MAYTEQQVRDIIQRGETDQVELKAEVRDAGLLSRIISGFANGSGGLIVIGAQSPGHITGCDRKQLTPVYDAARKQLSQTQVGSLEFVQLDGKEVGLLKVAKSDKLVASTSGAYVRKGSGTMSMTADQIFGKAAASGEHSLRSLSNLIYDQMITIDKLRRTLEEKHSWKSKVTDFAISGIVGAVLGVALSKIFLK